MIPRVGGHGRRQKARVSRARDQARAAVLLGVIAALPACTERISELDPRPGLSNLFFRTHLEGREPPPGMDGDFPHLSSVPPRPEPPSAETRARLSAGLAADREQSRSPLEPSGAGRLPSGAAAPPAPPRIAALPAIRPEPESLPAAPEPVARPVPAPAPVPRAAEPATIPPALPPAAIPAPATPAAPAAPAPAVPAPEPMAPPPAPSRDLFAPPPPPSRDLLAPRGG